MYAVYRPKTAKIYIIS